MAKKTERKPFEEMASQEQETCFGALSGQPKVRVMLPRIAGDRVQLPQEVFLNGVPYFIPRGIGVEVPEDIAQILVQAGLL